MSLKSLSYLTMYTRPKMAIEIRLIPLANGCSTWTDFNYYPQESFHT